MSDSIEPTREEYLRQYRECDQVVRDAVRRVWKDLNQKYEEYYNCSPHATMLLTILLKMSKEISVLLKMEEDDFLKYASRAFVSNELE